MPGLFRAFTMSRCNELTGIGEEALRIPPGNLVRLTGTPAPLRKINSGLRWTFQ
jgi:hypothetical protein